LSLVYGKIIAAHIDPIEKKPLYHVLPGSSAYSIASVGCNFRCSFCQNWDISQYPRDNKGTIVGREMTAGEVVSNAETSGCESIAYTYNEPTVCYEFTKDCGKLAGKSGIKNVYVSNGYMTREMLDDQDFIDAANIDLKSFSDDFYKNTCAGSLEPVLESLKYLKKKGVWVEVTTLVIPGDAFHPDYKMRDNTATPAESLVAAYKIGKEAGLHYIYVGNAMVDLGRNTECPKCGNAVIRRKWFEVAENALKKNKCPECGTEIAGCF